MGHCNIYRGINLLNSVYKIYAKIITGHLNAITKVLLQEEQHRFQSGKSCAGSIFTIRKLVKKRREFSLGMNILFVDYVKAFDRIHHRKLLDIMTENGYPEHMI
jgi:replication-associated recombination protein RarA